MSRNNVESSSRQTRTESGGGDWRDDANCLMSDPELFFPVGSGSVTVDQIDRAKRVCKDCPVSADCLDYALRTNQEHGVWGGMSEDERRALKRQIARQTGRLAMGR